MSGEFPDGPQLPSSIMRETRDEGVVERLNALGEGRFPGLIGFSVVAVEDDVLTTRLDVRPELLAPNGYLHAATVIGLADTSCGYGARLFLPEGATGFTTVELKANFIGTVLEGGLACRARLVHGGRTTQVWDATVTAEPTGKALALFRCTQAVLWPR
ncbi:MAG: putative Thioesterase superfamily protein [Pseudonocardia sp.]|nr:putative Thioesterase superfamily protein [Pseudonocardia sp.]